MSVILVYKPLQAVYKPVDMLHCAAYLDINKAVIAVGGRHGWEWIVPQMFKLLPMQ